MAIYEFYCPTCRVKFEERRPMSQASAPASCANGHPAERMVSVFAAPRGGAAVEEAPSGGCCGGGGCACSA
ncbi:FmdB family zinc ribbon protein [Tepidiforma sp.]|uniref:FmdB family zinc ribbon protein n=1 Tax=Tepidiforma sp. TaxID=2682230 RepID=UPI002ADD7759|nr:FmdB family zinc ribbon protein [Tepidiforma sp.]